MGDVVVQHDEVANVLDPPPAALDVFVDIARPLPDRNI
jgi:hypothetical protein